jgi:hypothetical protein
MLNFFIIKKLAMEVAEKRRDQLKKTKTIGKGVTQKRQDDETSFS